MADSGGAGAGSGTTATEKHIVDAQKSTNQLNALLAKLLHGAAQGGAAAAVEAILSDMSESPSRALASLQAGAPDDRRRLPAPAEAISSWSARGQMSVMNSGGRPVSRRNGQRRSRADGSSRKIIVQHGDRSDSYLWRKYGQKDILGARFARCYFKCGKAGCSARKQVQPSDADPSLLEEEVDSWLCIPSPACSQSELLSAAEAAVPELQRPGASPAPVECSKKARDDEFQVPYDSVVPELVL